MRRAQMTKVRVKLKRAWTAYPSHAQVTYQVDGECEVIAHEDGGDGWDIIRYDICDIEEGAEVIVTEIFSDKTRCVTRWEVTQFGLSARD
jgi:hypothetical protein